VELVVRLVIVAVVRVVVDVLLLDQQEDFAEDEVEDPLGRVDSAVQVAERTGGGALAVER
jgi:hypothetical protein